MSITLEHDGAVNASSIELRPLPAVEGWVLFEGEGGAWVRDLDLAERAEIGQPRDIRVTIKGAIKDGLITAGSDRDNNSPCFRVIPTIVEFGKGGQREVSEYYLNEAAALLIVMRLRTPKAVELTKLVVRVFLAAVRGELPAAPATLGAAELCLMASMISSMVDTIKDLKASIARLELGSGVITYEQDLWIKGEVEHLSEVRVLLGYNGSIRSAMTTLNQRVNSAAEWGGAGTRRSRMPADRFPRVRVALTNIRADLEAEGRRRKIETEAKAKKQTHLFSINR